MRTDLQRWLKSSNQSQKEEEDDLQYVLPYNQIQLGGSKEERRAATLYRASTTPLASSGMWRGWNSRNEFYL